MSYSDLPGVKRRGATFARGLALGAAGVIAAGFATHSAQAETRGYAVSWFYMAAESQADDCPEGTNLLSEPMARKIMTDLGKTPEQNRGGAEGLSGQYVRPGRDAREGQRQAGGHLYQSDVRTRPDDQDGQGPCRLWLQPGRQGRAE